MIVVGCVMFAVNQYQSDDKGRKLMLSFRKESEQKKSGRTWLVDQLTA